MMTWSVLAVGLICVAMMALMCVPMVVGMVRRRGRRDGGDSERGDTT
jgi:hypothetical protein